MSTILVYRLYYTILVYKSMGKKNLTLLYCFGRVSAMDNTLRRKQLEKAFAMVDLRALAEELNTTVGTLYNIKYGLRQVSAVRAIAIEKASKKQITRQILRPDIFQ